MDRPLEKKKWPVKRIIKICLYGVASLAFIYFIFFRDHRSKFTVRKDQLRIAAAERGKFEEYIPVDGVVLPIRTVFIDAVQGGTVEKIFVEDGAMLKKGDKILKLENMQLELDYMNRESQMYDVINNLRNSKLSIEQNKYTRMREMADIQYQIDISKKEFERKLLFHQQKVISEKEFEDASREFEYLQKRYKIAMGLLQLDSVANITQIAQINNSVERMNKNLALLRENLENLYIKAPIDGQLTAFTVEAGETKNPGQNLGQIDVTDAYKLRANVDERYISRVFIGQLAEFNLNQENFTVKIGKIYTNVSNGSFQIDLFFETDCPKLIKRGQTLQLKLKFSGATEALMIPRGGFFQETGGNWIYVVDPSGDYAVKRNIRIGRQNSAFYEVLEGLEPGEQVVISNYSQFNQKEKLIFQ